ncbi:MAG: glycosyltransferase family 4 protein [Lachnospiraceae bacterium]|nr:glycosyltransferase family 4 protein [Lachnospiraceae bacterium]
MRILMLVNWKIKYCGQKPADLQPPDYAVAGEDYWFYRYFQDKPQVDVLDIHSLPFLERFEKNKLRFYVIQALRAIPRLNQYDLIVSHGMQSAVVVSLWRRFFKGKVRHVVFEIGSFASASESGFSLKLMQFASKSVDSVIYHTSSQLDYYSKFFPWIAEKSHFIRFGTDLDFFKPDDLSISEDHGSYILCVGYAKRDWSTLIEAYQAVDTDVSLRLIGHVEDGYRGIRGVEQFPFMPARDLMNQIYNARFCVLPLESFNYSYGQMTLMQQMALEKCVIAARVPSLTDYVEDGKTALLYEPGSVSDLSSKMRMLLENEKLTEEIAVNGRLYLETQCNERIMASEIECMLNQEYTLVKK